MKRQIITFAGNKLELHKKLKVWCAEAETSVNKTVISLIEKHIQKNEKNKFNKNG